MWSQENTSILAAVYGPRQAQARKEDAEKAVIEVVFKPRSGTAGSKERDMESIIRHTIEGAVLRTLHPRTSVMVVLQVLSSDGAVLAVALNAACAALVDAGVPLAFTFAAVSCCVTEERALLMDPEEAEEEAAAGVLCAAFPSRHDFTSSGGDAAAVGGGVTVVDEGALSLLLRGHVTPNQLMEATEACHAVATRVAEFARLSLVQNLQDVE